MQSQVEIGQSFGFVSLGTPIFCLVLCQSKMAYYQLRSCNGLICVSFELKSVFSTLSERIKKSLYILDSDLFQTNLGVLKDRTLTD